MLISKPPLYPPVLSAPQCRPIESNLTVSVIIPLRNGKNFIIQALDSVFAQTLLPTEVIVVDDGSTDDGPDIVARYAVKHQLTLLRRPHYGLPAARNFAISHSTGKLIAFLDQENIWYPNHLKDLIRPFSKDPHHTLGWVYSDVDEITEDNRLRLRAALSYSANVHPKMSLADCLRQDMSILPSASVISKAALDAIGGFDEDLHGCEDDDLFLRLFVAGYRNLYLKTPLTQWRVCTAGTSNALALTHSRMLYARKLLRSFPDEPALSRFYASDLIAPRFLRPAVETARAAFVAGDIATIDACLADVAVLEKHLSSRSGSCSQRKDLLVTAIIPLYDGARFIRGAIESILAQTLRPDEIIVVDDGSTDDGPLIVEDMRRTHAIRLIRKENGGQSSARNLGVDHARGDLIAFLDQDDAWYPNHLAELIKPFIEERAIELGWSYSDLDEVSESGELINRCFLGSMTTVHPKRSLPECLRSDMFILPSASLISRKAFQSVGGFDERLSGYEDDDLFLRLFMAGFDNVYLPQPLSQWRIHQTSCSYSPRMAVSRATYARKLMAKFPDDPDTSRYYVRHLIAPRFFRLTLTEGRKAILKGTRDERKFTIANLAFLNAHLPFHLRFIIRVTLLPALRITPVGRALMRHRNTFIGIARRLL